MIRTYVRKLSWFAIVLLVLAFSRALYDFYVGRNYAIGIIAVIAALIYCLYACREQNRA
jgi:hypothetical protein